MNEHDETETPVPSTSRLNFGNTQPVTDSEQPVSTEPEAVTEQRLEEQPVETVEAPVGNVAVGTDTSAEQPFEAAPSDTVTEPEPVAPLPGDEPEAVTQPEDPAPAPVAETGLKGLTVGLNNDPEYQAELAAEAADPTPTTEPTVDGGEASTSETKVPETVENVFGIDPAAQSLDDAPNVIPGDSETSTQAADVLDGALPDEPLPELHLETPALAADERTTEDLTSERDKLDMAIAQRRADEKNAVLDQIKQAVTMYGLTTEDVVNALGGYKPKRPGVKAKTKYKDPATGSVWSGRGKPPAWIKGQDYSKFLIPEAERV